MAVEVINVSEIAHREKKPVDLFATSRFQTWVLYSERDDRPPGPGEMHCHNGDETFYCIEGECTMRFPDGGTSVVRPGMLVTITGGAEVADEAGALKIGKQNYLAVRKVLWKRGVLLHGESVGGTVVRNIRLEVKTGKSWLPELN